ncbi:hypothetical protein PUN28_008311 [Cardiocondyla obscurior]|uniref:Uncharacterized protein n=3 Tax=Cardiocondyla obscurior TaxID=286306 RepID=A0AAW2G1U6_9HYME
MEKARGWITINDILSGDAALVSLIRMQLLSGAAFQRDPGPNLRSLLLHTVHESDTICHAGPSAQTSLHGVQTVEGADQSINTRARNWTPRTCLTQFRRSTLCTQVFRRARYADVGSPSCCTCRPSCSTLVTCKNLLNYFSKLYYKFYYNTYLVPQNMPFLLKVFFTFLDCLLKKSSCTYRCETESEAWSHRRRQSSISNEGILKRLLEKHERHLTKRKTQKIFTTFEAHTNAKDFLTTRVYRKESSDSIGNDRRRERVRARRNDGRAILCDPPPPRRSPPPTDSWKNTPPRVTSLPLALGHTDTLTRIGPEPAYTHLLMDFSFHISVANMEEAFKAIKSIKNEAVWKSLAKMCVKTKQLNMALLCLGHMKQANAARALREAMQDDTLNLEAQVGILAVELGLHTDAERLFREAKRLDLLGRLYEARNKFKEAIQLGNNENKIREKTSYYNYARALEQQGKVAEAIDMYTKADCHRFEVPRMLLMRPRELLTYLNSSEESEIKNWHAQYTESTGDMETALHLYEQAKDTLSMTRLLCYFGRDDEVCELVTRTNHAAAAYHLAAHYESKNNVMQAIHFYTVAKAYTNAIRLCKEHFMREELWPLAILASRHSQIDVAKFYEDNNQPDRAVLLYHKAGLLHKALDVAFRTQQYSALQLIITDVNADSDPALIRKCADYFMQNDQIDKAVDLLATGRDYMAALNLIQQHNVVLNEELADKLTIEKVSNDNTDRERMRISTLEKIVEIAFDQGNYHLATKKFTQAGNKLRAMKALLKSGDTEKICFFAQVSRNREIYIMAGNYLQSLDWQNQPEILQNIINFYSKGKAMDLLANFYVACAQVEIDEFQNYEKALDALNQASRCLSKVMTPRDPDIHSRAVELVNNRMSAIKRYLDIKRLFDRNETETAMQQVRHLLDSQGSNLEQSVRRGDLFATITQHYANIGDTEKACATIEELKRLVPGINLTYYFNINLLEALGYKMKVQRQDSSDKDDGIEELLGEYIFIQSIYSDNLHL